MVVCNPKKFIFIEVPKTASTSIINALYKIIDVSSFDFYKNQKNRLNINLRHCNITQTIELFPETKDYFKFAFVRNPWDRAVSYYFWKNTEMSFSDFVVSDDFDLLGQCDYLYDKMDFIGRFENLQNDFDIICEEVGAPKKQLIKINVSVSKHKHYAEYYDEETKQIVAEKYAEDIEYFGYKFGE